jgi:Pyruvate/2-oxoacid:ferredoxin oxidoreductase delta subunit
VPIDGDTYETGVDTLILAVSQGPDWETLGGGIEIKRSWIEVDEWGRYAGIEGIYSGGDSLGLGIATTAIGHGRKAAECIDVTLRGGTPKKPFEQPHVGKDKILMDWYPEKPAAQRTVLPPEERLTKPLEEIDLGITREQAVEEASRCFSCGLCFGCENCWMYCQSNCFKKIKEVKQGHYYDIDLGTCDGCKKCAEECPCGFLDMI